MLSCSFPDGVQTLFLFHARVILVGMHWGFMNQSGASPLSSSRGKSSFWQNQANGEISAHFLGTFCLLFFCVFFLLCWLSLLMVVTLAVDVTYTSVTTPPSLARKNKLVYFRAFFTGMVGNVRTCQRKADHISTCDTRR